MDLFIKKPLSLLEKEAGDKGKGQMKRVLDPWSLIALGIGNVVGAGLFSVTGLVAANNSGPAITLSFLIASIACSFAGLCYAEFSSRIPVAGSSYTYSYTTMGELIAWIIGWDLVLEYAVSAAVVSVSWSQYVNALLHDIGIHLPDAWTHCPSEGGIANLPAVLIIVMMSLLLMRGIKDSAVANNIMVFLKMAVIVIFIILGWKYINTDNYTPYIPANTGTFGEFGWSGIIRGAGVIFFAYIGFDAVSTEAQETRNPQRDMPIGIIGTLIICTVIYMLFGHVMTGIVHYSDFTGQNSIAPVATAIGKMGAIGADGRFHLAYPWLNKAIILAILLGYSSVIMVSLLGQSRIFYSMSKDGLLPGVFSHLHRRFRTPLRSTVLLMAVTSIGAAFVPADITGEMISIGTLFSFILVCIGILITRKTMPPIPKGGFKVPFVPYIPIAGILCCMVMMVFLPADTWIRLVIWMTVGMDIYSAYGVRHSVLGGKTPRRHGQSLLCYIGIGLSFLCYITGIWHQQIAGWGTDKTLLSTSILFGTVHLFYYAVRLYRITNNKPSEV